ncbi:nucleoside-specific channel-forming protein Tsx, partial [Klebsiella pneumoniae]|nr:nucleoside-specific channel-forming protein Tsx [Klebsiella pneumoniae]
MALHYFAAGAAENDKPQYLSDWWHQSVNVVGSYHTRFGPQIRNDTYRIRSVRQKDWFDFYGYIDAPVFFGGNSTAGIWNKGSPLFMEIEPRFSIDKLTNTDLSWAVQRMVFRQQLSTIWAATTPVSRARYGSGYRYRYRLAMSLSLNVYAKYQWQNYGASNENEWDGFKVKY